MKPLISVVIAGVLSLFVMPVSPAELTPQLNICVLCRDVRTGAEVTPSLSTNPSSASAYAPGHGATPPGQGGTPPGQAMPHPSDEEEAADTAIPHITFSR